MTISNAQFTAWLKNPDVTRVVLVEAVIGLNGGGTTTRYLSNKGYTSSPTDTPSNTYYQPRITGSLQITRGIDVTNSGALTQTFGDLALNNTDGALDSWFNDYWVNRPITYYVGDPSWDRSDFRQVFAGVCGGIDTSDRVTFNVLISDKLQRLNTTVSEATLGGTTALADNLVPLTFGECFNISPLLTNGTINEYQVHNGPVENIIEVRDNGVPVSFTASLATGKFTLTNQPYGTVTCSVQGAKVSGTYSNTAAALVKLLITTYGSVAANRFLLSEINTSVFTTFDAAHPQPVGIYLSDRQNVLDVCNQLLQSLGSQLFIDSSGLVSIVQLSLPQSLPGTSVGISDMQDRTLAISTLPPVVAAIKLGYNKNWTVQTTTAGGLEQKSAALFAQEWLMVTQKDTAASANYNLYTDTDQIDTLLQVGADATIECNRRLNIFNVQRKVLKYSGFYHLLFEQLGDPQTLTHPRFGLSGGVTGQIVSIAVDYMSPVISFEVLI